jgi:hypothetical protein
MKLSYFYLAQKAYAIGAKPLAEKLLRKVVKDNPQNDAAWLLLAKCTKNWEEKIEFSKKCIVLNRNNNGGMKEWLKYCDELPRFSREIPITLYELPIPENRLLRLPARESIMRGYDDQGDWFAELNADIWIHAGEQEFVPLGTLFKTKYDRIIKLTYRHYICVNHEKCTLFRDHLMSLLVPVVTIKIKGEITLDTLCHALEKKHPQIYADLSKLLYKNPLKRDYISHYRYYAWGIDDSEICLAVRRVNIDNNFKITPLDILN